jgi:hypothetical protein
VPQHVTGGFTLKSSIFAALAALTLACAKDEPRLDVDVPGDSFTRLPVAGGALSVATIPFEVKNTGGATAFVQACDNRVSATIQKRVNDQWEQYSAGVCLANVSWAPVELREGARNHGDVGITETGRYRVRIFYALDAANGYSKSSASDPFEVR